VSAAERAVLWTARPGAFDRRLALGVVLAVAVWQLADLAEGRLPLSVGWALIDEAGHAGVAAAVLLWTLPAWGWRPTLAAILAGTVIDVDHAVAAGSLAPSALMSLAARPASHSLLGVMVATGVGALLGGRRIGLATLIGVLTHIARDATADPGVPLLVPWIADWHVLVPAWSLPLVMVCLAGTALTLSWRTQT